VNSEFSFTEGINLILGPNGAGKSSIFEAIGLAMFDVKNLNFQDYIRMNEKSAEIKIVFEGNDGMSYTVFRCFDGSSTKCYELYLSSDERNKITHRSEILARISEICGIDSSDPKNIFTNIICGYQNDLTTAFKSRPLDRKRIFDEIFEIDIYSKIFESLREVSKEYEIKMRELDKEVYNYKSIIEEHFPKDLEEELSKIMKEISIFEEQKQKLEETIEHKKVKKKSIEKRLQNIENSKKRLEDLKNHIDRYKSDLNTYKNELSRVQMIKKELENREKEFREYNELSKKVEKLVEEISKLRRLYDETKKFELETERLQKDLEINNNQILNLKKSIDEKTRKIEETKISIDKSKTEIKRYEREEKKIRETLFELKQQKKSIEYKKNEKSELEHKYHSLMEHIEELSKKKDELKESLKQLEVIEAKIKLLEKNETILEGLDNSIRKLRVRKESLLEELESLKQGICPILNIKCEKLLSMDETNFLDVISKMDVDIKLKENRKKTLEEGLEKLRMLKNEELEISTMIKSLKKELNNFDELLKQKVKIEGKLEEYNGIEMRLENINERILNCEKKISGLTTMKELEAANLSKMLENVEKLQDEIKDIQKKIDEMVAKNNGLNKELNDTKTKLKSLSEETRKLKDLEKERSKVSKKLETLKEGYEFYLKSKSKVDEIPKIEKRIIDIKERIETYELEMQRLEKETSEQDIDKLENELSKIEEEVDNLDKELRETMDKISGLNEKKKNLQNDLEKREELLKKLENAVKEKNILNGKFELLNKYRNNIKEMGNFVVKEITKSVGKLATEYYRRLTGKSEKIVWLSENSYEVYLVNDRNRRAYRMLSGGEQMSIAIALRLALAKLYSNTRLLILDEPTSNLDHEKKEALANAMNVMVNDLDQVFIVTHDELFAEMSQNIINIKG